MSGFLTPARVESMVWAVLCGGLLVGMGMETDWGNRWQYRLNEVALPPSSFSSPALSKHYSLPAADQFLETAMRPVFIVTRRPSPPPPPPEPPKPTMRRDQFVLTGVSIVPEGKFAFLLERSGNKSRVVGEGKEINGIQVRQVLPDRVLLSQYDETETLVLRTAKAPAPAQSTATPGDGGDTKPGVPQGGQPVQDSRARRAQFPASTPQPTPQSE